MIIIYNKLYDWASINVSPSHHVNRNVLLSSHCALCVMNH